MRKGHAATTWTTPGSSREWCVAAEANGVSSNGPWFSTFRGLTLLRDLDLDQRYLIPIVLGLIAVCGAGFAVGSTVGGDTGTRGAVHTITITRQVKGTVTREIPDLKTVRVAARVTTIRSAPTTAHSNQAIALPVQRKALTSTRTVTVPPTLTATTTEVSTVISVMTVTETAAKTHPPHPTHP